MRKPSENGLFVLTKTPEADIFFVTKSNTCFLFEAIVSNRAGSLISNLSYLRLSIVNTFLGLRVLKKIRPAFSHEGGAPSKAFLALSTVALS